MIPEGVMAGFAGPSGLARTGAVGISLPRETGCSRLVSGPVSGGVAVLPPVGAAAGGGPAGQ